MGRKLSMRDAAKQVGVNEQTIARWVKGRKLKATEERRDNLIVKLVDVEEAKALAKQITRGRPPKQKRV